MHKDTEEEIKNVISCFIKDLHQYFQQMQSSLSIMKKFTTSICQFPRDLEISEEFNYLATPNMYTEQESESYAFFQLVPNSHNLKEHQISHAKNKKNLNQT